jgi:uncharacterized protein (TIGR02145 family)
MGYNPAPGSQGLSPPGWHVPTEAEWMILFNFYQGQSRAGKPMQDMFSGGFTALFSGVFYSQHLFSFEDFGTFFWSSTLFDATKAISHGLNSYNYSVSFYPSARGNAFAVRCLRD